MDKDLITLIKEAGVVGAGGAGFPTHVKVKGKADYIVVNGAECEPLLRVDQQLMAHRTKEILQGLRAVIKETGAMQGIIALKGKYSLAIEKLKASILQEDQIEIFPMKDFYPAGDEQVTVYEVLKKIVPEGGIPLQVGVIVVNVETLLNIQRAIKGLPVTHKYVTVTGAVKQPITLKAPIGISIRKMIELAGGAIIEDFKVIEGGPMMGKIVDNIDKPITKTTKGLIVLPHHHPLILSKGKSIDTILRQARTACCHCSLCTEVCPRNLLGHKLHPDKLMRLASYNSTCENDSSATEAFLCCECGLCETACIMDLQPWKLNQFLKEKMSKEGIKNPNNRVPQNTNDFREYRKFPVKKLIARLGLEEYNVDAPLIEDVLEDFDSVLLEQKQHIGGKAEATVKVGDYVKKNQTVAEVAENQLGARIHASIDGRVQKIDQYGIMLCKPL
ncbi:4Fe-4S dicluster domain-containing protein [Alkaliphilus peptidifermentans]|uniref:Na+-translocating ferredoxin:NAD+ oxidoreductase RNF, RnfC subunit n=1 Tax=Alkaliphilus peptidifermentans DSM 18978 TaxID=1120976 RepID=A0A1G5AAT9_9FIRM|nr:4Fe-4S dicluster domain-containing protein [Alkaliphilus peptidifermentans]SCX74983.1 Na+-translocating ferredoxin:NAD+ oxidoreductase RNF, RnfC subunit [Alkaliphilus peptidifermentans DSM 18978]